MARPRAFDEAVVLQKALDTFWHRGYSATSMEDLVAGTGLNRASLYATFGDKHQLFMQALRHYYQRSCQTLTTLTADTDASPLDHIRQILELTLHLALDDEEQKGCFLVNSTTELASHDADAQVVAGQNLAFLETLLTTILGRGQQRGEVRRTATPQAQARLLISVLNGMLVMAKARSTPQQLRDVVDTALLALV
ncbi:TetR/AcrR family transcriptional regulator [uncultured Hymenobacter sp.]|uniref:TetR/AcrR family transcriptional regulator n=1 Tax=uncultured Hymenobacter sp. TaxID=170016 RepID=UPI0035CBC877